MDPENNNSDWFGNLCLQINDFLAEASTVIPQEPIQQACHQFTVVTESVKRIYTEMLENLPIFLSDVSEGNDLSCSEQEQEENVLPPLTNTNTSSAHNFQQGGIKSADSSDNCLDGGLETPHIETNAALSVEEVAPENIATALEFHGSRADPYVQSIIVSNISDRLDNGLKVQDSSSHLPHLPTEAEDEANRAHPKNVETELDKGTISTECDEHTAYSYVQTADVSFEDQEKITEDDDEDSSNAGIGVDSHPRSDWSISDEDSVHDSGYDPDSDLNLVRESHLDWFIVDTDGDWDIVEMNLL